MKNLFIFALVAVGIFVYKDKVRSNSISSVKSPQFRELVTTTTCQGKASCIVVYVAPWCPACHSMTPAFKLWKDKSVNTDCGVKIIVGKERTQGDNEIMAQKFGEGVVIDTSLGLHDSLPIEGYPTILLVQNGIVTKKAQDAFNWANQKLLLNP